MSARPAPPPAPTDLGLGGSRRLLRGAAAAIAVARSRNSASSRRRAPRRLGIDHRRVDAFAARRVQVRRAAGAAARAQQRRPPRAASPPPPASLAGGASAPHRSSKYPARTPRHRSVAVALRALHDQPVLLIRREPPRRCLQLRQQQTTHQIALGHLLPRVARELRRERALALGEHVVDVRFERLDAVAHARSDDGHAAERGVDDGRQRRRPPPESPRDGDGAALSEHEARAPRAESGRSTRTAGAPTRSRLAVEGRAELRARRRAAGPRATARGAPATRVPSRPRPTDA